MPSLWRPPAGFYTRADAEGASIAAAIKRLETDGFGAPGEGRANYIRAADATLPGSFSSVDGDWKLAEPWVTPEMFGEATVDDSARFNMAIDWAQEHKGRVQLLNRVYTLSEPLPYIEVPISLVGFGPMMSWIKLDTDVAFDTGVIRLNDTGFVSGDWPRGGNTLGISSEVSGPRFQGFSIVGDKTAGNVQHGLMGYHRVDNLFVLDVEFHYLKGHGMSFGHQIAPDTSPAGYLRESEFARIMMRECGDLTNDKAAFLLTGTANVSGGVASGDNHNQNRFFGLKVIWSAGVSMEIRSDNPDMGGRRAAFFGLMTHAREEGAPGCHNVVLRGDIGVIQIWDWASNSAPSGFYNMLVDNYTTPIVGGVADSPTGVYVQGAITSSGGGGIYCKNGDRLHFEMIQLTPSLGGSTFDLRVDNATNVSATGFGHAGAWSVGGTGAATVKWPTMNTTTKY